MLGKKRNEQKSINKPESFLSKLHDILKDNTFKEIIHWDTDGKRVIISDVVNYVILYYLNFINITIIHHLFVN